MIPYQEASESLRKRDKETSDFVKKGVKTAVNIGTGIATGSLLSRAIPLLNKFVPTNLAIKGLSKLDKRFGKFFKGMEDVGNTAEDALNFVRDKLQKKPEQQENANPESQEGSSKQEALAKFMQNQAKKASMSPESIEERLRQSQEQMQPQQQQVGQGQQALMAILDKINQRLGG